MKSQLFLFIIILSISFFIKNISLQKFDRSQMADVEMSNLYIQDT